MHVGLEIVPTYEFLKNPVWLVFPYPSPNFIVTPLPLSTMTKLDKTIDPIPGVPMMFPIPEA